MINMIGKTLNGRYEVVELIGRGGMAFVYKAKDLKLHRFVAIKVLKEEYSENEQFIRKFERESQSAAGLSHPNIVSVYDVGEDEGIHFIVMELVNGITLKQYLNKKGILDYDEATSYVVDVAEALSCAHSNGIIHRDIKPQNILLTRDLLPKVTDFGIARAVTSSTVTMTKETMGSVHYISPEQARGGFLDERSDLYSLGILYYELVTGELPFDEDTTVTIAIRHIREEITPPIELNPHIPKSVNDVILKLTRKSPDERYQDAKELIADLDAILVDPNAAVAGTMPPKEAPVKTIDERGLFRVEQNIGPSPFLEEDEEIDDLPFERKKNKNEKNKKKIIIGGVIAAAVVIIGLLVFFFTGSKKEVTVPDLTGMTKSQAEQTLKALNLTLEIEKEVFSADMSSGKIVTQNPDANAVTTEGKTVKVSISKGSDTVSVPEVIGKSESDAIILLEKANLAWEVQRSYNSDYSSGTVYKSSPASGEKVSEKTKVVIYVSQGTETASVPGIVGLTVNDANSRIQANGFTVGTVTEEYNSSYNAGIVSSQSLNEGTKADKGTAINYVVSLGPKPEPTPDPKPDPTPIPENE